MKKYLVIGGVIVIVFIIVKFFGVGSASRNIPTMEVAGGEFVVSQSENGKLNAKRSMTISSPRIRGSLQIVKLAEEGSIVNEGDFLVQFDPTEQETKLRDAESELKIARANLEKALAQYDMDIKQLELDLLKAERSYTEKQSEAPAIRKEAEIERNLAQLKYDSQKKALAAEIEKMEVEVQKATDKKDQATRDLEKMTLKAPIPGLVVYLEIWKGGSMSKVQEGDSPWSGQGLIELPDLSTMIVETTVSEVDVSKIEKGQSVKITLDAIPGAMFTGKVTDISTLAHSKQRGSSINVFDVEVEVDSTDDRLKPGMSAKADIIINRFEDVLSVPLEAVFERDDTTIVYLKGGKKRQVSLGARNETSVIVASGLEEGDEVCLIDPERKEAEPEEAPEQKSQNRRRPKGGSHSETIIIGG